MPKCRDNNRRSAVSLPVGIIASIVLFTSGCTAASTLNGSSTPRPSSGAHRTLAAFPDATNTGYEHAPGYPGKLTDCDAVHIKSNTTYRFCNFSAGADVGNATDHPVNVRFIGCRFASNNVNDANVADYGSNITFSYSTFEPSTVPASSEPTNPNAVPISAANSYEYGIDLRDNGALTIDHSDFWGFSDAVQFGYSSAASPVIISNSWIHNPSLDPTGAAHVDGILNSYGGISYMTFEHNTITGNGNTQALALQGSVKYDHVTITNNYFSGFGYTVCVGGHTLSTNVVFTGNVWGTDIKPAYGPLYSSAMFTTPDLGNDWHGNRIHVITGTSWMATTNNGLYWWPGDGDPASSQQVVGHRSDYSGP
jgi:hypothetical protein